MTNRKPRQKKSPTQKAQERETRARMLMSLPLENRNISAFEVQLRTGRSIAWCYEQERKGNFPRRFRTSPDPEDKGVAWNGNELAVWIANTRLRTLS